MKTSVTARWLAALLAACATPQGVRRIEAAHRDAAFEATTQGCTAGGSTTRRFGRDLRVAVLWSRQVVRDARQLPCEVVIDAVSSGTRRPVYRVRWPRDGPRTEGPVPP